MNYADVFSNWFNLVGIGSERRAQCLWHPDSNPSLCVNVEKGVYWCPVCGAKGNTQTLARELDGTDLPPSPAPSLGRLRTRLRKLEELPVLGYRVYPESWLYQFLVPCDYWGERGLRQDTIERFQLGYSALTDSATIPLRGPLGHLLGVVHRRLDGSTPKYHYPEHFNIRAYLFGSHLLGQRDRTVCLVEGQLDAIACWQAEVPALAQMGSTLHRDQLDQLRRLDIRTVRLFYDNDLAGRKARERAVRMLEGFRVQYVEYAGEDPGSLSADEIVRAVDGSNDRHTRTTIYATGL